MGQVFSVLAKGGVDFSQNGQESLTESTLQFSTPSADLDISKVSFSESSQKVLLLEVENLEEEIEENWGKDKFENQFANFLKTLVWGDHSLSQEKLLHFS